MKKIKLISKQWIFSIVIGLVVLFAFIAINNILKSDIERHIEKVSQKCASQGYGITHYYTKQGDKFYKCNVGGQNEK